MWEWLNQDLRARRPPTHRETVATGVVLVLTSGGLASLWTGSWVAVALAPVVWWLSIGAHELGHAAAATAAAQQVASLRIGDGPSRTFTFRATKVQLGVLPTSGLVRLTPVGSRPGRWRRASFLLAGPTVTLVLVVVAVALGPLHRAPAAILLVGNGWMLLNSLVPQRASFAEGGVGSDMWQLLRLRPSAPATPFERMQALAASGDPGSDPQMAIELATAAVASPDLAPEHRPQFANSAAYFIVVLGLADRYAEADRLSAALVEADPDSDAFVDTRGCVLAVLGRGAEALPMLERGAVALEALEPWDGREQARGWSHMLLARAHLDVGDVAAARTYADRAAALGVDSPVLAGVAADLERRSGSGPMSAGGGT